MWFWGFSWTPHYLFEWDLLFHHTSLSMVGFFPFLFCFKYFTFLRKGDILLDGFYKVTLQNNPIRIKILKRKN